MAKRLRKGKVFIDWSQNSPHKSTVCVYSVRAKKDEPFISVPLDWDELARGVKAKKVKVFEARPEDAIRRCEEGGDLFQPVVTLKQKLPAALKEFS
jgi:bifunctional non-homologous end joining protein LigD